MIDEKVNEWDYDQYGSASIQRNRAYWVAIICAGIALLSLTALVLLLPLKETTLKVAEFCSETGEHMPFKEVNLKDFTASDALNEKFVYDYIRYRERVDIGDRDYRYRLVQVFSSNAVADNYINFMKNSPESPIALFKANERKEIYIRTSNLLKPGALHVELEAIYYINDRALPKRDYYAAVVDYQYVVLPKNSEFRFDNPLGFKVTRYRINNIDNRNREIKS